MQSAIIIYIFILKLLKDERSIFDQIYIINNIQKQFITRYNFLSIAFFVLIVLNIIIIIISNKLYIEKKLFFLKVLIFTLLFLKRYLKD